MTKPTGRRTCLGNRACDVASLQRPIGRAMKMIAALFVVIWSTGFIVAKAIVPVADPSLFLAVRCSLAGAMFLTVALVARVAWPRWREVPKHLVAGALMQGGYLGGTYWAVAHGLAPSVMALRSRQPSKRRAIQATRSRAICRMCGWCALSIPAAMPASPRMPAVPA